MNSTVQFDDAVTPETSLLKLQIQIARRADELTQIHGMAWNRNEDRCRWLEAEREILGAMDPMVSAPALS